MRGHREERIDKRESSMAEPRLSGSLVLYQYFDKCKAEKQKERKEKAGLAGSFRHFLKYLWMLS